MVSPGPWHRRRTEFLAEVALRFVRRRFCGHRATLLPARSRPCRGRADQAEAATGTSARGSRSGKRGPIRMGLTQAHVCDE